jgi:hypothetical protein
MPYPMKQKESKVINEQDILFDNVYEEVAKRLDWVLDEVIEEIEDEWGINNDLMMKIVDTWSQGVSVRLPLTTTIDKKTMELLKKEVENVNK